MIKLLPFQNEKEIEQFQSDKNWRKKIKIKHWYSVCLLYSSFAFSRARMIRIGDANECYSIQNFCNRPGSAFITEIATTPVCRIGELSITSKSFSIIIQNRTATLRCFKVCNFLEFRIVSRWKSMKSKRKFKRLVSEFKSTAKILL